MPTSVQYWFTVKPIFELPGDNQITSENYLGPPPSSMISGQLCLCQNEALVTTKTFTDWWARLFTHLMGLNICIYTDGHSVRIFSKMFTSTVGTLKKPVQIKPFWLCSHTSQSWGSCHAARFLLWSHTSQIWWQGNVPLISWCCTRFLLW